MKNNSITYYVNNNFNEYKTYLNVLQNIENNIDITFSEVNYESNALVCFEYTDFPDEGNNITLGLTTWSYSFNGSTYSNSKVNISINNSITALSGSGGITLSKKFIIWTTITHELDIYYY